MAAFELYQVRLAQSPLIARERSEFMPAVCLHRHQSHIIIYRLTETFLNIFRIVHVKQNWNSVLGE
jgi:plasmid stabilization system protein ParE